MAYFESLQPDPPSAPSAPYCRMYGALFLPDGTPMSWVGIKLQIVNSSVIDGAIAISSSVTVVTDRNGYFQVDMIPGLKVAWNGVSGRTFLREFVVPTIPVVQFFDYAMPRPVSLSWEVAGTTPLEEYEAETDVPVYIRPVAIWSNSAITSLVSVPSTWLDSVEGDIETLENWSQSHGVQVSFPSAGIVNIPWPEVNGNVFELFGYNSDGGLEFTYDILPPPPLAVTVT